MSKVGSIDPEGIMKACTTKALMNRASRTAIPIDWRYSLILLFIRDVHKLRSMHSNPITRRGKDLSSGACRIENSSQDQRDGPRGARGAAENFVDAWLGCSHQIRRRFCPYVPPDAAKISRRIRHGHSARFKSDLSVRGVLSTSCRWIRVKHVERGCPKDKSPR